MPRLKPPSKEASQLLPPYAALPDCAIYVPASDEAFAQARQQLLMQTALGFDTESKPIFHTAQIDTGPHVVQLATPHAAWLLQLHHPQAMQLAREIIAHPGICKVGFGLDNDKSTLPQRLGVPLAHVLDLDRLFQRYGYGASTGVRAAVALVLGQNFHKSKKQSTSNWSLPRLNDAQVRYAANDAHAPAMVYAALPRWQAQQPDPDAQRSPPHHAPVRHANAMPQPPSERIATQTPPGTPRDAGQRPRPRAYLLQHPAQRPTDSPGSTGGD